MNKTTVVAVLAASKASRFVKSKMRQQHKEHVKEKGVGPDIVTAVDVASERIILETITSNFPNHQCYQKKQATQLTQPNTNISG